MGLRHPVPITYKVATISRLLKIIGLFCKRALEKRPYSAKETYHFKEPTNRSKKTLAAVGKVTQERERETHLNTHIHKRT